MLKLIYYYVSLPIALAILLLVVSSAYGQTFEITQPTMVLMKDGVEVSRHRDVVEAAVSASANGPGEYTLVRPDATIFIVEPEPVIVEPDPVVADDVIIQVPGSVDWVPVPDWGVVKKFSVANDDYGVVSDNQWLYVFKIGPTPSDLLLVNRPALYRRTRDGGEYLQSETTPLTDEQVLNLIVDISN